MDSLIKTSSILLLWFCLEILCVSSSPSTYGSLKNFPTPSPHQGEHPKSSFSGKVIPLAVQSQQTIDFINVDTPEFDQKPYIIEIGSNSLPLILQFKSASSRIQVKQMHTGSDVQAIQESKSEDQPHHIRHEVIKPIIQEVHEIIKPYRHIIQEIKPVHEEIQTIVAKKRDSAKLRSNEKEFESGFTGSSFDGTKSSNYPTKGSNYPITAADYTNKSTRSTRLFTNYDKIIY